MVVENTGLVTDFINQTIEFLKKLLEAIGIF